MHLEGPVFRPSGEMTGTADSVRLRGRDAGAVVVRAHTASGEVVVDLEAPRFGAEAKASVGLDSPRPWTAQVGLNGADVVQALTLMGVNPDLLVGSTATLSASAVASGNLNAWSLSNGTLNVGGAGRTGAWSAALAPSARNSQPCREFGSLSSRCSSAGLGAMSVHAAGSWGAARDTPEGIAVNLDARVKDVLEYLSPEALDRWNADGSAQGGLEHSGWGGSHGDHRRGIHTAAAGSGKLLSARPVRRRARGRSLEKCGWLWT
jgi:hypothetical protein